MNKSQDWNKLIEPLLKKYKGKKHPLDYNNLYQLIVMVVLSAQSSDKLINEISPELFKAFPDFESLARTDIETLTRYISKVTGFGRKAEWLIKLAKEVKHEKNIQPTIEWLTKLPGIGRKSANVIMRESKVKAEGVIVDLHVLRVGERLGISTSKTDAKKVEKEIMKEIHEKDWGEIGMAISFLGREICRPSNPKHDECVMKNSCKYYKEMN